MDKNKIKNLNNYLTSDEEMVCDLNGNCEKKKISSDKSIVERVNKKIIIEDGRQLLM